VWLEFLTRAIWQRKEIKGIQTRKEDGKLSLLVHDMILYLKDLKDSSKKLKALINTFSIVPGYKINMITSN
jgi:hypothetical protein